MIVFIVVLAAKTLAELYLLLLNRRNVLANAAAVPEAYQGVVDEQTYRRSVEYTLSKQRVGLWETLYDAVVLALVVGTGFLGWLYGAFTGLLGTGVWGQGVVCLLVLLVLSLPALPWDWYGTFRLEARFGFNKSSLGLWLGDKVKGLVLGAVLGIPLLALLGWFFGAFPTTWWLWSFVAFFAFQILLLLLYPRLILPLFNKLAPLEEGELRQRLLGLGTRTGFTATQILVMDGSKRSGHSNAFFTGMGRFRKIVLFDTLIEQLSPRQLEAVLAHEIGHYKHGHIVKMLVISCVSLLVAFAVMGWLSTQGWLFTAFNFSGAGAMVPTLLLLMLLGGLFTFWFSPLTNALSRKHEYEADAFARAAMDDDPQPLVESLHKLHEKNLSNLTPHPVYSTFYYSHPTLAEREAALKSGNPSGEQSGNRSARA